MKKSLILSLLMLSACGLPREQIKAENAQKLSEMQIRATNDMHQKEKTDKQYLGNYMAGRLGCIYRYCVQEVKSHKFVNGITY